MKLTLLAILVLSMGTSSAAQPVPGSESPDGKLHAVLDMDRDPTLVPEWKGDSFPHIELTEISTGKVLQSVRYYGAAADDQRPLREHVEVLWRPDATAFALTINDRFYSSTLIFAMNAERRFVRVEFPSYEDMTGFPTPDPKDLRPRGRSTVKGWDTKGRLLYSIFLGPEATYSGKDPLSHEVVLEVAATGMKCHSKVHPSNTGEAGKKP